MLWGQISQNVVSDPGPYGPQPSRTTFDVLDGRHDASAVARDLAVFGFEDNAIQTVRRIGRFDCKVMSVDVLVRRNCYAPRIQCLNLRFGVANLRTLTRHDTNAVDIDTRNDVFVDH